jgi:hypothetical protein
MDRGFAALRARVASLPSLDPSRDARWGPFEVLSHISGWHLLSARRLEQIARGEEPSAPGSEDELNAGFVAERAALSREQLLRDLAESYSRMREAVLKVDESEFWIGGPGQENSLAHFIPMANGPEHYQEHEEDLNPG